MKIKINKDLVFKGRNLKGKIIEIKVDSEDTPLEKFWRSRLKDSSVDQCIEIVKNTKMEKKEGNKKSEKNKNNNKNEE